MRMPGAERAVVDEAKVRDYLLSTRHPIGRFKATFMAGPGYSHSNWPQLCEDLQVIALNGDAILDSSTPHGQKYRLRTILRGPNGRSVPFTTMWIQRHEETFPRFVTGFPGGPIE